MQYKIVYCTHCETWTTVCPGCGMGGCSGGHLPNCKYVDEEYEVTSNLVNLLSKTNLVELLSNSKNLYD